MAVYLVDFDNVDDCPYLLEPGEFIWPLKSRERKRERGQQSEEGEPPAAKLRRLVDGIRTRLLPEQDLRMDEATGTEKVSFFCRVIFIMLPDIYNNGLSR